MLGLYSFHLLHRGAFLKDATQTGEGVAPAGGAETRTREAPGPDRRHYDCSAGSLLDWGAKGLVPGNADPGTEIAANMPGLRSRRVERREAPAFSKVERGKTEDGSAARRSIPSPAEGNESKPRRARGPLRPERADLATTDGVPRRTPRTHA